MKNPDLYRIFLRAGCLLLAVCSFCVSARASGLTWGLAAFLSHRTSTGDPLPGGTRFQLGVFTGGFIPSASNVSQWLAHWRPRAETEYDAFYRGFSSGLVIEADPLPFTTGTTYYMLGYRQVTSGRSEWILATDPDWLFPVLDPLAFPVDAELSTARTVILGSIAANGVITTASVPITTAPHFPYTDWTGQWFYLVERTGTVPASEPLHDLDGDGEPNVQEYLTGQDPRADIRRPFLCLESGPSGLHLSHPAVPSAALSHAMPQQAASLSDGWTPPRAASSFMGLCGAAPSLDIPPSS